MVKRVTLVAAVVAALISGQAIPAAADTGFTLNDFKVTHAVADVGASATVTVEGTVDRDLIAGVPFGGFNVHPTFDLQQSCANLVTPTDTIVATTTRRWPNAEFDYTVVVPSGQHGTYLDWTVTVFYDPALDTLLGANGICPSGGTSETTYVPLAQATLTSMSLAIWPGCCSISPFRTKKGEPLLINLEFPSGHTEY